MRTVDGIEDMERHSNHCHRSARAEGLLILDLASALEEILIAKWLTWKIIG